MNSSLTEASGVSSDSNKGNPFVETTPTDSEQQMNVNSNGPFCAGQMLAPGVINPQAAAAIAAMTSAAQLMVQKPSSANLSRMADGPQKREAGHASLNTQPRDNLISQNLLAASMPGVAAARLPAPYPALLLNAQMLPFLGAGLAHPFSLVSQLGEGQKTSVQMSGSSVEPVEQPSTEQSAILHENHPSVAAAAVAAPAAAAALTGTVSNAVLASMQHWTLKQLESHVQMLRDTHQPIPHSLATLLADSRRLEAKRAAKRVANRKSACTSRARKKALMEEMTKANARLRRQALILSLLPDLVIAINTDGLITFCSAQVERVLRHKVDDLIGADLSALLVPASRDSLEQLIQELVKAEQVANNKEVLQIPSVARTASAGEGTPNREEDCSSGQRTCVAAGGVLSSGAESVVVTEKSFPMEVVKLEDQDRREENSDLSTSNNSGGKVTRGVPLARSRSVSSILCNDANDEGVFVGQSQSKGERSFIPPKANRQQSSSDDSSSSSDARNLRRANEALSRNVRWHNEKILGMSKGSQGGSAHKDDVTGAFVTANNADARLSSLQHRADSPVLGSSTKRSRRYEMMEDNCSSTASDSIPEGTAKKKARKSGIENSSEDSGYRESNESCRDDSLSDTTSSSRNEHLGGLRGKPLAPACNICLIREDLTTIWCEVTSSIRTRSLREELSDEKWPSMTASESVSSKRKAQLPKGVRSLSLSHDCTSSSEEEEKELLLCLRPIRDGEDKVSESLRFVANRVFDKQVEESGVTVASKNGQETSSAKSGRCGAVQETGSVGTPKSGPSVVSRPPKKRQLVEGALYALVSSSSQSNEESLVAAAKRRKSSGEASVRQEDSDNSSVIESLMLMSTKSKS